MRSRPSISVRFAQPEETRALLRLDRRCFPKDETWTLPAMQERLQERGWIALVTGSIGKPNAYLLLRPDTSAPRSPGSIAPLFIERMGVIRRDRGLGLCSALVRAAILCGARSTYAASWNTDSLRTLIRNGFLPVSGHCDTCSPSGR